MNQFQGEEIGPICFTHINLGSIQTPQSASYRTSDDSREIAHSSRTDSKEIKDQET